MVMVSDAELVSRLHTHLAASDLTTTTNTILRRKLEQDLGLDLSDRKVFLRQQVESFLQNQRENSEEDFYGAERDPNSDDVDGERDDDEEDTTSEEDEEEEDGGGSEERKGEGGGGGGDVGNGNRRVRRGIERYDRLDKEPKMTANGFSKLFVLSPQLQKILGATEMAQPKVLQQIWAYIREKSLQDPSDKKNIICDDSLRSVFGVDSINMFEINKALMKHLKPMDAAPAKKKRRARQRKQKREEDLGEEHGQGKRLRKNLSGFLAPARLSPTLVGFLGTGESELTRAAVISRIWDYIKEKHLQDPQDTRMVLCDEKLKALLGVDSFRGFAVSKLLSPHLQRGLPL